MIWFTGLITFVSFVFYSNFEVKLSIFKICYKYNNYIALNTKEILIRSRKSFINYVVLVIRYIPVSIQIPRMPLSMAGIVGLEQHIDTSVLTSRFINDDIE